MVDHHQKASKPRTPPESQPRIGLTGASHFLNMFFFPLPAPQSQNKRKASGSCGSDSSNKKSPAAPRSAPVRRSPRSHQTPMVAPAAIQDVEAPSHLAASHRDIRPQLSQVFRRLYGTTQHRAYWQVLPFSNCTVVTVNAWAPPGPETQPETLSFSFEQLNSCGYLQVAAPTSRI
jgi:hypothetical protein